MIELQFDPERITTLAPLYLETCLAGPDGDAAIVAPASGAFHDVAQRLQTALADRTGKVLGRANEAEFHEDAATRHTVAVGHSGNNRLIRRLHDLCLLGSVDEPDKGHHVVSVHNPFGAGRNVIVVSGSRPEVAQNGVAPLVSCVRRHNDGWLVDERLLLSSPSPERDDLTARIARIKESEPCDSNRWQQVTTLLEEAADLGDRARARAFTDLVQPVLTRELTLGFYVNSAIDFWTGELVSAWDRAEEFPFFSNAERLQMANLVVALTQYCHDSITYLKWHLTDEDQQVFNHHTHPALGLLTGCLYLQRHAYDLPEATGWMRKVRKVLDRAMMAGRSFDEGGAIYSSLVGGHLIGALRLLGETEYFRSQQLRSYADYTVASMNNHFEMVPYGDSHGLHAKEEAPVTPFSSAILLRAAEGHVDGGYRWVAERHAPRLAAADLPTRDLPAMPPSRHRGLFVLPMDPVIHRWTRLPRFPGYPPPPLKVNVPPDQGFDKLTFRGGWRANDDYLLLQGYGGGAHGHPDANSISMYQARGRLFLTEWDYIRRMPWNHNTVMVIRDGEHGPVPVTARLDLAEGFAGGAVTRTTLCDYNGCDWSRTLVWLQNDCLICVDDLLALEEGDYELRCYWRSLGSVLETDRGFLADHDGEKFHLVELTDSERALAVESPQVDKPDYTPYRFGDPRPKVMRERVTALLPAGSRVQFINLLLPNGTADAPRRSIERAEDGSLCLRGPGRALTVTAHAVISDGKPVATFGESLEPITAARLSPPRLGAVRTGTEAALLWEGTLPSPPTCVSAGSEAGLFGCEDGSVVALNADNGFETKARMNARVGAVLAACIHGESTPSLLAADHDGTLLMMHCDGTIRRTVSFPRGTRMPARGYCLTTADLDADGRRWPILGSSAWRVYAVAPDGSFRWDFPTTAHSPISLLSVDLDADGREEIVTGTVYFCVLAITPDGKRLWHDEDYNDFWEAGPIFPFLRAGDIDDDGHPEIVTAAADTLVHCIDHNGTKQWTCSIGDEAAGLELLGTHVVAASRTGDIHCLDGRGRRAWRKNMGAPCSAMARTGEGLCVGLETGRVIWLNGQGDVVSFRQMEGPVTHLLALDEQVLAASATGQVCLMETASAGQPD